MKLPAPSPDLLGVVELGKQVNRFLCTGTPPLVWTPAFPAAVQLVRVIPHVHAAIAPQRETARQIIASWPAKMLGQRYLRGARAAVYEGLRFFVPSPEALSWWRRPNMPFREIFWGLETHYCAWQAMTQTLAVALQSVEDYSCFVEEFALIETEVEARLSPSGAAILAATIPGGPYERRAIRQLLRMMGRRVTRIDRLPPAMAGWFQTSERPYAQDGGRMEFLDDAGCQRRLELWELLAPIRDLPMAHRLEKAMEPEVQYLPRAAGLNFLNRLKSRSRSIDPVRGRRRRTEEAPDAEIADRFIEALEAMPIHRGKVRRAPEHTRDTTSDDLDLRSWLADPPKSFLRHLTPTDRKILEEYRKALRGETRPLESERDIAARAGCSPPAVAAFLRKVEKYRPGR